MASLLLEDLHNVIDNLGAENNFKTGNDDFAVCIVDEATFRVYNVKEVFADKTPGHRTFSLVIDTKEVHDDE